MSRKHKIIISITGIVVITLALIGVTYGYFLTRVTGNTNDNSILLTTANLELKYDDNNSVIDAHGLKPAERGDNPKTKTFKVSNTGDDTVEYGVYLESVINDFVGTEDLVLKIECTSSIQGNTCNGYGLEEEAYYPTINTLLLSNSIVAGEVHNYILTLEYLDSGFDQSIDMGKTLSGKIQIYNPTDIVALTGTVTNAEDNYYVEVQSDPVTSQIKNGTYYISGVIPGEHTVFVKYLDDDNNPVTVAQKSIVISKGAEAGEVTETNNIVTIPILATTESITLPISIETSGSNKVLNLTNIVVNEPTANTLAQKIIDNAKVGSGTRTVYTANPSTTPGQVLSTSTERTLSTTDDVYTATTGNKSYYFRGNVEDNYVTFANMCWRIVRIQGDGSIKLILADGLASCSNSTTSKTDSGYITYSNGVEITSTYENIVTTLNDWYSSKGLSSYQTEYLKNETWYDGDDGTKVSTTGTASCNDPYYDGNGACTDEVWDSTVYEYVGGNRISNTEAGMRYYTTLPNLSASPKLNTPNEVMYTGYIGTLNADEVAFAGSAYYNKNSAYYLSDNVSGHYWWTLTMAQEHSTSNKYAYSVYDGEESACSYYKDIHESDIQNNEKCSMGIVTSNISSVQNAVRPVITLKDTVMYKTGDGTPGNAYQVK